MLRLLDSAHRQGQDLRQEEEAVLRAAGAGPRGTSIERFGSNGGRISAEPKISLSSETFQREVERQVSAAMQAYSAQISDMVEKEFDVRTRDFELSLRSRLSEIKSAHDAIAGALKEVARAVEGTRNELLEKVTAVEAALGRKISIVERECNRAIKQGETDIAEMRDMVASLDAEKKSELRSGTRRLDELTNRHKELLQDALASIDGRVGQVRQEQETATRDLRKLQLEEMDSINRYVLKLQATTTASDETIQKMHAQLTSLFDGHGSSRSQIRMLEQQVNRLESSLRSSQATRSGGGASATGSNSLPSPSDMFRMQQDIFALKQSVAFLYNSSSGANVPAATGAASRQQHMDPGFIQPLKADQLRPPYLPSNRSTPTKSYTGGAPAFSQQGQRYNADSPTVRSPNSKQFVTVHEDSEDEYENSKLANSALD